MVKCEKYGKEKEKDMPSLMWLRFVTIQKMTFIILQMIRSLYQLKGYTQSQCVPDIHPFGSWFLMLEPFFSHYFVSTFLIQFCNLLEIESRNKSL